MKEAFTGRVFLLTGTLVLPAGMMWGLGAVALLQLHADARTEESAPILRIFQALAVSGGWTCAAFGGVGVLLIAARIVRWWLDRRADRERADFDAQVASEAVLEVPGWHRDEDASG